MSQDTPRSDPDTGITIGFIGLGAMGYPMAGHLARKYPTLVWNRSFEKAQSHAAEFGSQAVSLQELAGADVIFSCLPTSKEVDAVAGEVLPVLTPGGVWVDCTSGVPDSARALATQLAERGWKLLDAPVSGGTAGAQAGQLTVMVGGDPDVLERVRPVIEVMASTLVWVGPQGLGFAVKAVNNALLAAHIWLLGEGLSALSGCGAELDGALTAINASSGRSNVSQNLFPSRVLNRTFPATFKLGLLAKDAGIALDSARAVGVPVPALALIEEFTRAASRVVGAEVDHTAMVRLIEGWTGQELKGQEAGKPS